MDIVFNTEKAVFNYRVAGIWIEDGHVLIHKDVNNKNWSLPGGRVEIAEDTKNAIKREFIEELGIDIEINRLYWVVENFFDYRETAFHEISFYYGVTSQTKSRVQSEAFHGQEGDRLVYQWVPIEQLPEMDLYPEFLRTALHDLPEHFKHLVVRQ